MLDRLERDDRIEARVGKRQRCAIGLSKLEVRDRRVPGSCMIHRGGLDVGARHRGGAGREERAAVPFAAGDVEHAEARDERGREMVAMPVLVPDLAGGARNESLAREFEVLAHCSAILPVAPALLLR